MHFYTRSVVCRRLLVLFALILRAATQSISGANFFLGGGSGNAYNLVDDYEPSNFFSKFNFYNSYDPTYGHVQYVDQGTAANNGYIATNAGNVTIGVDTTNKFPRGGPGRPSVRIISDNTYTHGLFVLDLTHMPWGCGTWPAFWLLGPNWPSNGEVDIIEGVNTGLLNSMSMHTSDNCTVAGSGASGTFETANCYEAVNGNSGCGFLASSTATPNNYGRNLNNNGGGVYVTEWTSNYIQIWFFGRNSIPSSITSGTPNITQFGKPAALFQGCDIDAHFNNHSIIINTDFCGAWAGNVYSQCTDCPQNSSLSSLDACVDFVGNNPQNFTSAYWSINSIKVYQLPRAGVSSTYSQPTTLSSSSAASTGSNSITMGMGQSTANFTSSVPYTGPSSSPPVTTIANLVASATSTLPATTSFVAGSTATCPSANDTVMMSENEVDYSIYCGADTDNIASSHTLVDGGFEACFDICDSTPGCTEFTFVGYSSGTCYFKNAIDNLTFGKGNNFVVGRKFSVFDGSSVATSVSASSSTAGSAPTTSSVTVSTTSMSPSSTVIVTSSSSSSQIVVITGTTTTPLTSQIMTTSASSSQISTTNDESAPTTSGSVPSPSSLPDVGSISTGPTESSTATSTASPASSTSSVPVCPSDASQACGSSSQGLTCKSSSGCTFDLHCGLLYTGTVIDTSNIIISKRATVPDYQTCANLCDQTTSCVAFNYMDTNCTLLSSVSGSHSQPGAIQGSVIQAARSASGSSTVDSSGLNGYGGMSQTTPASGSVSTTQSSTSSVGASRSTQQTGMTPAPASTTVTTTVLSTILATTGGSQSSSALYPTGGGSLCFTCFLTPTVVQSTSVTMTVTDSTCSAGPRMGTTTVYSISTVTSCVTPLTCLNPTGIPWFAYKGSGTSGTSNSGSSNGDLSSGGKSGSSPNGGSRGPTNGNTSGGSSNGISPGSNGGSSSGTGSSGSGSSSSSGSSNSGSSGSSSSSNSGATGSGQTHPTTNATTTPPVCPRANDETYISSLGQLYSVDCGSYMTGSTVGTTNTSSLAACIDACDRHNANNFISPSICQSVSWFGGLMDMNCELVQGDQRQSQSGVDSAVLQTRSGGGSNSSLGSAYGGYGGTGTGSGNGNGNGATTVVYGTMTSVGPGGSTVYQPYPITTVLGGYGSGGYGSGGSGSGSGGSGSGGSGSGGSGNAMGTGAGTGPGTGPGTGLGTVQGTRTIVSNGQTILSTYGVYPSTVYGTTSAVTTIVSNGVTYYSTYGVSTALSVVYLPGTTVTTTSVSVSVSVSVSSAPGATHTVSGSGGGGGTGGGTVTATVVQTVFASPTSSHSSFVCRSSPTSYLSASPSVTYVQKRGLMGNTGFGKRLLGVELVEPDSWV